MIDHSLSILSGYYNNNLMDVDFSLLERTSKLVRLYLFYNLFSADEMKVEELEETIIKTPISDAIYVADLEENIVQIIKGFNSIEYGQEPSINELLLNIENSLISVINGACRFELKPIQKYFFEQSVDKFTKINYKIILSGDLSKIVQVKIKNFVNAFKPKSEKFSFDIEFENDLKELILDIENPVKTVASGKLTMHTKESYFTYGEEKSLITTVTGNSVRELYINHEGKGLFSMNLRFHVKNVKIDDEIKKTINTTPDLFWYYNNGLTITCSDYTIQENTIYLKNFSIVNGGQTATLIGRLETDNDFHVMCKIVKNKYKDESENDEFVSKIAINSNTQKPIKTKDLIANRIDQIRLKKQFAEEKIFLQVKRGDKLDKTIYKEKWQNASNDEVGQMLFSMIYQHPGFARNGKSKMLENNNYYNQIYTQTYSSSFLVSLQHIKVGYYLWLRYLKKHHPNSAKEAMAKNSFFMFMAVLGFLLKLVLVKGLNHKFCTYVTTYKFEDDDDFKEVFTRNDIGTIDPYENSYEFLSGVNAYRFFDFVFDNFIMSPYNALKTGTPNMTYSNFTKTDVNYYRYIIPAIRSYISRADNEQKPFSSLFYTFISTVKIDPADRQKTEPSQKLSQKLKVYATKLVNKDENIKNKYSVFRDMELVRIEQEKPKTIEHLREILKNQHIVDVYGVEILNIIKDYII